MTDALEDHEGTVSIWGRTITYLHFADDIDDLAREKEKQAKLVGRLDKGLRHEDQCPETKLTTNNTSGNNTQIQINGENLETVTSFKYLGCYN